MNQSAQVRRLGARIDNGSCFVSTGCEMRFQVSFKCWLLGHEDFVRGAQGRLYLECIECGRETPGWRIGKSGRSGDAGVGERLRRMVRCVQFATRPNKTAPLRAA